MNSFVINMADLYIRIDHKYDYVFNICKDYITQNGNIDIIAKCSDEDINKHLQNSLGYSEGICLYESIGNQLHKFNKALIHAAVIEYNGLAYLFLAKSGTGKSTHIALWKKTIPNVSIINGDKPIVDGDGYVYGTPWCGKEGWNVNTKVKIGGIIILNRDVKNHIEKSSLSDNLVFILSQIYKSNHYEDSVNVVDKAFKGIPVYKLGCNTDEQAAKLCFDAIIGK